jgi:exopolysaccharide production protein ExoQ
LNAGESLLIKMQRYAVYLLCVTAVLPFAHAILEELRRNKLIIALCLWAFASVLWSQNPRGTAISAIFLIVDVGFAVYLLRRFPGSDLPKLIVFIGGGAAAATLFVVVALPEYGVQARNTQVFGAWQGIFEQKNICGSVFTLLLLPIFFVETKRRFGQLLRWLYGGSLLGIIAMTQSAGAWVVCSSCISFIVLMRAFAALSRRAAAVLAITLAGIGICAGYIILEYFGSIMQMVGKDPTMTGRTTIWAFLLPSIMKHPLVGYGYMAFWQEGLKGESANVALSMNWPGIGYSENGLIDLLLGLGAIAVLLFLLIFGRAVRDAFYCFSKNRSPRVMWYISMLFFVTVSNIAAGQIFCPSNLGCILQVVTFVGLAQERKRLSCTPPSCSTVPIS